MRTFTYALVSLLAALSLIAADFPLEPRLALRDKVDKATLVVVGTMTPPAAQHGKERVGTIAVESVLIGPSNVTKTLAFEYRRSTLLDPGVYSSKGPLIQSKTKCIFFLTSDGTRNSSSNTVTRAVGSSAYAHDAIEILETNRLHEVLQLIETKNRPSN